MHLNFAFREPLVPDGELPDAELFPGRDGGRPWVTRPRTLREAAPRLLEGLTEELAARPNAIVVAGRAERDPRLAAVARRLRRARRLPAAGGAAVGRAPRPGGDRALRRAAARRGVAATVPDLVLRVGDLPTSKPLRTWLAGLDALQVSFDPESAWQDPAGAVGTIVGADPRTTLDALAKTLPRKRKNTSWLDAWHAADRAAARAIAGTVGPAGLNEPRIAAELGTLLPPEATLVVASSMPVRDVETFFPVRDTPFRVLSNRGANGIDGTVSTAFGVSAATAGADRAAARRRRARA